MWRSLEWNATWRIYFSLINSLIIILLEFNVLIIFSLFWEVWLKGQGHSFNDKIRFRAILQIALDKALKSNWSKQFDSHCWFVFEFYLLDRLHIDGKKKTCLKSIKLYQHEIGWSGYSNIAIFCYWFLISISAKQL